ncbi:MAG: hypothetical protein Q9170_007908 [Blastenia crenularia]
MAFDAYRPLKRSSFTAGFDSQIATKRNKLGLDHHKITQDVNGILPSDALTLSDEGDDTLLMRSIGLALDAVGFEAAEPLALQSFRMGVAEYMHQFAANVRQSMLSCRRTQATAQDFLQALHTHQLSLRTLLPHLRPPVEKHRTRIKLLHEPPDEEDHQDHQFIGPTPDDTTLDKNRSYIPPHLPAFPSKHTYKETPEYPEREEDPRKIRERATEEGRLAEEALRRLVSAKVEDRPLLARAGARGKSIRIQRDELWKQTMEAAGAHYLTKRSHNVENMEVDASEHDPSLQKTPKDDYGRISSAVNAEKKFWRKPAPRRRLNQNGTKSTA